MFDGLLTEWWLQSDYLLAFISCGLSREMDVISLSKGLFILTSHLIFKNSPAPIAGIAWHKRIWNTIQSTEANKN